EKALRGEYKLILLDLMLPDLDGYEICRRIREQKNTPIIMVSAKKEDFDKIRGLGLGADDYITKPFSPSELVARVVAHISRYERLTNQGEDAATISSGNLELDKKAHRAFVSGTEVILTNKEFELLCFLLEHPNVVYSKEELFDEIWKFDSIGETSTITVHVNRIRDKIKEVDPGFSLIETVWGSGYRFRA
ncbi:MAG: response regulator transcription factor, partial [Clostridiales bacterium]|nr:response regulator transcription factor [Clostridiales bacterium]